MGKSNRRPVSREKLLAEFERRDITPNEGAAAMGYSSGIFAPSHIAGGLTMRILAALRNTHGIQYADIAPDPEPVEPEKVEPVEAEQLTITPAPIEVKVEITPAVITEALVDTMMNQEVRNQLVQIVYYAVNKAIRNNSER